MVYPPKDGHPSRYKPGPTCVNFVHATNAANHYATPRRVVVDCSSSFSCVGSLFHAHGAATEKALSLILRCVCGTTRLPDDKACSADNTGTLATDVSKSNIYSDICSKSDLCSSKHNLNWILSATGNQCNSCRAGVMRSCGLRSRTVHAAVCRTPWNGASQHRVAIVQTQKQTCAVISLTKSPRNTMYK